MDNNAPLRSVAGAQLRDAGVGHLVMASSVKDARLMIECERFDSILCNREFEGSDESGQDLIDELHREHVLPQLGRRAMAGLRTADPAPPSPQVF